ncbi:heterokaryon incompatibility protein-domain-containing protein [Cladorrhinum sp. PSN259]|nr:heterokaryon incompatibility protein-domain-containing protein [Cladorrhinum sp. PSN259]
MTKSRGRHSGCLSWLCILPTRPKELKQPQNPHPLDHPLPICPSIPSFAAAAAAADGPFAQLSPLLSYEQALSVVKGLDRNLLSDFFDPVDITQDHHNAPCNACLNLHPDKYKDLADFEHCVQLYQLHLSAKQGCIACTIIFNRIVSPSVSRIGDIKFLPSKSEQQTMVVETITISLRRGYVPHISRPSAVGFDLIAKPDPDSPCQPAMEAYTHRPSIPETPTLEHSVAFVRPLLEECDRSHGLSCQRTAKVLPKRLLDVENGTIKLVDTEISNASVSGCKYIALSHCWGESRPVETKTCNLARHYSEIPWERLSNTFKDAITLTRSLGIPHIWIDSLCIIQDDPLDWEIEAAKMASVYSGCYLTIAATGSKNGDGGCFFSRPVSGWRCDEAYVYPGHCKLYARYYDSLASHHDFTGNGFSLGPPLMTRAWCFQERFLSARVLHFSDEEIVWECRCAISCECGYLKRAGRLGNKRCQSSRQQITDAFGEDANIERVLDAWLEVIEQYSVLEITRESDRFPALAGLAERFSEPLLRGQRYLAGLWENDLWRGLTWKAHESPHHRYEDAPSWSWASMKYSQRPPDPSGATYIDLRGVSFWRGTHGDGFLDLEADKNLQLLDVVGLEKERSLWFMRGQGISLRIKGIFISIDPSEVDMYGRWNKTFSIAWDIKGEQEGVKEVRCLLLGVSRSNSNAKSLDDHDGSLRFLVLQPLPELGKLRRIGIGETIHESHSKGKELFDGKESITMELV